jgi:hypothetical protein
VLIGAVHAPPTARADGAHVSLSTRHDLLEISKLWTELSDLTEQHEAIVRREEGDSQPLKRGIRADRGQA